MADDNPAILRQVSNLLETRFEVEAVVDTGTRAVEAVARLKPDIAILDIAMPGLSGIEAARKIREMSLPTKIIFLTIQRDSDYLEAAAALDAGYVLKSRLHLDLLIAIEHAIAGKVFVSPVLAKQVLL